jgi:membrane protease YdiL (CAAX protease family)
VPFFLLAFGFTWALQVPGVAVRLVYGPGHGDALIPLAALGIFGPLVAAVTLTAHAEGRAGVRRLFAPLRQWRVHPGWYFAALFLPGLLLTAGLALMRLAGRGGPVTFFPAIAGVVLAIVISLAEEVGWRGYAQPRLEQRYGVFGASGVVGVLWMLWHIPMFLGADVPLTLLPVMLLYFLGGSLLFAWIQRGTGGSLLLVVLAHVGAHLNNSHAALPGDTLPLLVSAVVYGALGLAVSRGVVPRIARTLTPAQ